MVLAPARTRRPTHSEGTQLLIKRTLVQPVAAAPPRTAVVDHDGTSHDAAPITRNLRTGSVCTRPSVAITRPGALELASRTTCSAPGQSRHHVEKMQVVNLRQPSGSIWSIPAQEAWSPPRSHHPLLDVTADGAQEALGGAEHLGCAAHGVGRVVVVVETAERVVCCHCTSLWSTWRGPDAVLASGPRRNCYTICRP